MKWTLAIFLAIPAWACVAVQDDHILGKDLAAASADFAVLDASIEIGFAPRAGVTRVFQPGDLAAIARKYGVTMSGPPQSVCFMRPLPSRSADSKTIPDVQRGSVVSVEVTSGAARLRFDAEAASSGRLGDSVLVRNPENGKLFQARVDGKGKVLVQR